jgi:hypothetical protein
VIVDAASKQVVAWLRDSASLNTLTDAVGGFPTPLAVIINAAKTGVTLWDGRKTREAIGGVSNQVAELSGQMHMVGLLNTFTASGQLVNLALTAATFQAVMQRLDRLSQEVNKLGEIVRAEFARDRDTDFQQALEAARDAFESATPNQREQAIRSAVDGLYKARVNFLNDFQQAFDGAVTENKLFIAQHCLIRAMYAEMSRIRCYIAANELNLAKQRLQESIPLFHRHSQTLVRHWIGEHPAIFFHKEISAENVDRFLQIQQWLYQDGDLAGLDKASILFRIVNDLRNDFWDMRVTEDEYGDALTRITRRPVRTFKDRITKLTENLDQAEMVIENHQRLYGLDLELRSMRLSFHEWEQIVPEADLREHDIGIIVDKAWLDHAHLRLA